METRQHKRISLAQNFLRSPKLVRRLVVMSTIGPSNKVYEIGPGNGIITAAFAGVANHVIAIEKDPGLVHRLRERFRLLDNVEIVEKDFLAYSFATSEYKIFASIPYNRTAQILRKILYERSKLSEAYLILQRTVTCFPVASRKNVLEKSTILSFRLRRGLSRVEGFAQKVGFGCNLLGEPLRISAFSAVNGPFQRRGRGNTENAEKTNRVRDLLCKARLEWQQANLGDDRLSVRIVAGLSSGFRPH